MDAVVTATNATKGLLLGGANIIITGLEVFEITDMTEPQKDWVYSAVNFIGLVWIAVTRKWSRLRKDS